MAIGNFSEKIGTRRSDRLTINDLKVAYGLAGNDALQSRRGQRSDGSDATILVGGSDRDTYIAGTNMTTIILESGNSDREVAIGNRIGFSQNSSFVLDINGRHLYAGDDRAQQYVLLINWKKPSNRIETFQLADGTYSYQEIVSSYRDTDNYLGNFSWNEFVSTFDADDNFDHMGLSPSDVDEDIQAILRRSNRLERKSQASSSRVQSFTHALDELTGSDALTGVNSSDTLIQHRRWLDTDRSLADPIIGRSPIIGDEPTRKHCPHALGEVWELAWDPLGAAENKNPVPQRQNLLTEEIGGVIEDPWRSSPLSLGWKLREWMECG